jgi:hypothetical protein
MYSFYSRYVVTCFLFLPVIIGLINYRFLNKPLRVLLLFNILTCVLNIVAVVLAALSIHNTFLFHFYSIFEFALISWFYKLQFKGLSNKIIPSLVAVYAILSVINFLYIQNNVQLNTYTHSIEAIIIIGYCLIFINRQSQMDAVYNWVDLSFNWINTGVLIFYSCSFFTFMLTNYIMNAGRHVTNIVWATYDTFIIFENILFAIAYYKCKKQPTISSY